MSKLLGVPELSAQFVELTNMGSAGWKNVLRSSVRTPMRKVKSQAQANISKFSPGKATHHRTYRGRLVGAGFAARNVRLIVKVDRWGTSVTALLGVAAEAFYAAQFFELGTALIPRQPWLVPALEALKTTAVHDVGVAMKQRIESIARKKNQTALLQQLAGA